MFTWDHVDGLVVGMTLMRDKKSLNNVDRLGIC